MRRAGRVIALCMHVACLVLPGVARGPHVNCIVRDELIIWFSMWCVNYILTANKNPRMKLKIGPRTGAGVCS